MVRVTVAAGAALHCPLTGSVSQTNVVNGVEALSRRARAVSDAAAPILLAATANRPVPPAPPVWEKPSLDGVKPTAIMSGTGFASKASTRVSTPTKVGAALTPAQEKPSAALIDTCGALAP